MLEGNRSWLAWGKCFEDNARLSGVSAAKLLINHRTNENLNSPGQREPFTASNASTETVKQVGKRQHSISIRQVLETSEHGSEKDEILSAAFNMTDQLNKTLQDIQDRYKLQIQVADTSSATGPASRNIHHNDTMRTWQTRTIDSGGRLHYTRT